MRDQFDTKINQFLESILHIQLYYKLVFVVMWAVSIPNNAKP